MTFNSKETHNEAKSGNELSEKFFEWLSRIPALRYAALRILVYGERKDVAVSTADAGGGQKTSDTDVLASNSKVGMVPGDTTSLELDSASGSELVSLSEPKLAELIREKMLNSLLPSISSSFASVDYTDLVKQGTAQIELECDGVIKKLPEVLKYHSELFGVLYFSISRGSNKDNSRIGVDLSSHLDRHFGRGGLRQHLPASIRASDLLTRAISGSIRAKAYAPAANDAVDMNMSIGLDSCLEYLNVYEIRKQWNVAEGFDITGASFKTVKHTFPLKGNSAALSDAPQPQVYDGKLVWPAQRHFEDLINEEVDYLNSGRTHILSRPNRESPIDEEQIQYVLTDAKITNASLEVNLSPRCRTLDESEAMPVDIQKELMRSRFGNGVVVSLRSTPNVLRVVKPMRVTSQLLIDRFNLAESVVTVE